MVGKAPHYSSKFDVLCPLLLPADVSITPATADIDPRNSATVSLCERYYDPSFENHNTRKGGGIQFGYGNQGLPLVLYSNAPNNSLFIIWLNTKADADPPFTSLFTRIDRHKPV
jgi:hypothetical protein